MRVFLFMSAGMAALSTAHAAVVPHQPEFDTIVVTASPLERPGDALLVPASVLEGEELERQMRQTLGETLRREPGVSATGFGVGASRPIIRGLGGDRIRTLTNGVGSIDAASASPDHAVPIEPALAERIEVVRGSSLLRYGSSAAGGVVNVLDGRIASAVPEGGADGGLRLGATTVDDGVDAAAAGQVLLGEAFGTSVVLTGSGSLRDAEDYDIPGFAESAFLRAEEEHGHEEHGHEEGHEEHGHEEEGPVRDTLENSFNEVNTYAGGLSFIGERGFLGFSVQRLESSYGIPAGHDHGGHGGEHEGHEGEDHHEEEGHHEEEHHEEDHHGEEGHGGHGGHGDGVFIELDQTRFDVNGELELEGPIASINLFGGYADYEHTEFEGPGEPGTVFANEGYEIRIEGVQRQVGNWRGASGVQYRDRDFSAIGEEAFVPPTETTQLGVFTFQEVGFGAATVEGALRYEETDHERSTDGFERSFSGWSASLGSAYRFNDMVGVTATVLRTERAPTTEELFSNGPHLATNAFEVGDATLGLETALGVEAGFRLNGERFDLAVTGFYTDYEDFIYEEATGLTGADILTARGVADPGEIEEFAELPAFQFTAADTTFSGFEVSGRAALGTLGPVSFEADLVADYVEATLDEADASGSDQLPRIPPFGVVAGLDAEAGAFSFRAEVDYAAEVDEVAAFETPTDSFVLTNLYADWEITPGIEASLAVLNLTDEEARLHTSFLKDEVPLPGRNIRFAVRYRF